MGITLQGRINEVIKLIEKYNGVLDNLYVERTKLDDARQKIDTAEKRLDDSQDDGNSKLADATDLFDLLEKLVLAGKHRN